MCTKSLSRSHLIASTCLALAAIVLLSVPAALGREPDLKAEFLALCDANCKIVEKQSQTNKTIREARRGFCWDSYVVRALCVAYDMTGKQEYLDVCKLWSDRMIEYQDKMIPEGIYYMQYGRKPGEGKGDWYVGDCTSIALAVLATAIRCEDSAEKARYLSSVKSYAKLVIDRFVRSSGGVTDGQWPKSDKEWWCSTGVFGSLAFHLYKETGDESYLKIGRGTIDWLNRQDLLTVAVLYPPEQKENIKPTVFMYCLEAYSTGLAHLEPGSPRHKAAMAQLAKAHKWMLTNWGGKAGIAYITQWGGKFGGLPFHVYVYAEHVRQSEHLIAAADDELRYISEQLQRTPPPNQRLDQHSQLAGFAMMSYAEKLSPGSMYRTSKE